MMIPVQSGNNCMVRGLATMRLTLGYTDPVPQNAGQDVEFKNVAWLLDNAPLWFPDHDVFVFCGKREFERARYGGAWYGEVAPACNFDGGVVGFAYNHESWDIGHFVVGTPAVFPGMQVLFVIYVEYNEAQL